MKRPDQRSPEAQAYRALYNMQAWRGPNGRRAFQLRHHPLCAECKKQGRLEPADTVDHIKPHRGDRTLFLKGPVQSLCTLCHSRVKQGEEARGYSNAIGPDGYPTDPRHPSNRARP